MLKKMAFLPKRGTALLISAFLAWALLGMLGVGWASAQEGSETTTAVPAAESADAEPGEAELVEEEIEWQIEEGSGRRFRIIQMPRRPGTFRYTAEDRIRVAGGANFEVVEEDESFFWIKAYETFTKPERRAPVPVKKGPTEEEKRQMAETYVPEVTQADRLRLEPFDRGLPKRGQWRNGFDIADMNGDGHLDIVFGPIRKGRSLPNLFLGDGAGNWRQWREAKYPEGPYDYGDAAAGDFNGDGHLDMVFGIHLRGLFLIVGDGKGGFTPWTEGIAFDIPGKGGDATSFSSRAVETIDWDGDGKLDVIALGEGPKGRKGKGNMITGELINTSRGFGLYLNRGDGTWEPRGLETRPTNQANFADDFAIGDFNGDGKKDLVTATRRMGTRKILAIRDAEGGIDYQPLEVVRPRAFIDTVDVADYDGDGRDDIAAGFRNREGGVWRTGIDLYLQKKEGWQRLPLMSMENRHGVFSVASGDIDGDGDVDVVAVTGRANVLVFTGDGEGGFAADPSPELASLSSPGCKAFEVRLVDLSGDGRAEITAAFAGEQVGFPGMANLNKPGCPGLGSLRVWQTVDLDPPPSPSGD